MTYLLDTCALIWILDAPEKMNSRTTALMKDDESRSMGFASITLWEVSRKESLGNLGLSMPSQDWLRQVCSNSALTVLPLSDAVVWDSCHLPGDFHRDPADRIIVASARVLNLTLVTTDRRILEYPHVKTVSA